MFYTELVKGKVIMMKTTRLDLVEMKNIIEQQIGHPYLAKFVKNPNIDEDKLLLLISVVDDSELSLKTKQQYIITTMLVQIALDTHELVSLSSDLEDNVVKKRRQLTVLAGDYYSGLYYYLLSKLDDSAMIHTLASAIKEINECKMELYQKEVHSFHEFAELVKKIESLLIQNVAEFLNRPSIKDIAPDWLLMKRLVHEKSFYDEKGRTPLMDLLIKQPPVNSSQSQVLRMIESMIFKSAHRLEQSIVTLPVHFEAVRQYMQNMIYDTLNLQKNVLEEG